LTPDTIAQFPVCPADLKDLSRHLERQGCSTDSLYKLLEAVTENPASLEQLHELKSGLAAEGEYFERFALYTAGCHSIRQIDSLPLDLSIRKLWHEELAWMIRPHAPGAALTLGTQGFEIAAKTATLRRFPAGPLDWEVSGIPRSWVPKTGLRAPALVSFVLRELGGFSPLFFLHMARKPRNRSLIMEREVMKMYYRIVQSMRLQPEIRGIMTAGWFNDSKAISENPHLEWVNRPYLNYGGFRAPMELADEACGVAEGNAERKRRLDAGDLGYRICLVIWPRKKALAWADENPQLAI
jgi:hypothetical protein